MLKSMKVNTNDEKVLHALSLREVIRWLSALTRQILSILARFQRAKPIIIDPGLYQNKKTDIFWATQRRALPTAFRLFTGLTFP